jgi:predicted PurR-regulated permease PerM
VRTLPGRTLFLLAVAAGVLWLGYLARDVVTPLLAALLLAYVLDPAVRLLQRLRMSRAVASGVVVALTLALVATVSTLTATRLTREATSFYHDVVGEPAAEAATRDEALRRLAPELSADVSAELREAEWQGRRLWYVDEDGDARFRPGIAREGFARLRRDVAETPWAAHMAENLRPTEDVGALVASSAGKWLSTVAAAGGSAGRTFVSFLTLIVLFPIYLYYSLAKLSWVYDVTIRHLPAAHRDRVVDILAKIHATLAAFFRGRLILLLARWLVLLVLFLSFGVPFAGVCALFGAVASLVPVLGPVAGGAVPLLLLLSSGAGTTKLASLAGALALLEVVEGYVLTPAILGKRVGLHPLTILVATFVAGDLLGIFGMLVAIPLTAVLKILAIEFVLPEVRRQAGLAPDLPSPAETGV